MNIDSDNRPPPRQVRSVASPISSAAAPSMPELESAVADLINIKRNNQGHERAIDAAV
jgi:hypothetical protein